MNYYREIVKNKSRNSFTQNKTMCNIQRKYNQWNYNHDNGLSHFSLINNQEINQNDDTLIKLRFRCKGLAQDHNYMQNGVLAIERYNKSNQFVNLSTKRLNHLDLNTININPEYQGSKNINFIIGSEEYNKKMLKAIRHAFLTITFHSGWLSMTGNVGIPSVG